MCGIRFGQRKLREDLVPVIASKEPLYSSGGVVEPRLKIAGQMVP